MVFEKLREIFANQFGVDPETITESTDIISDLGADSLDVVEITIEDEKVAEMKTVADVVRCVEGLIEG